MVELAQPQWHFVNNGSGVTGSVRVNASGFRRANFALSRYYLNGSNALQVLLQVVASKNGTVCQIPLNQIPAFAMHTCFIDLSVYHWKNLIG
jgi:hypothetical protein